MANHETTSRFSLFERVLRSNRFTPWAIASLGVWAFLSLISVDYLSYDVHRWHDRLSGEPVAVELAFSHGKLMNISKVVVVASVLPVVLFLAWQLRAHAQARELGAEGLRFRPWVALVGWLVPVVNLVAPALALSELWKASNPDAGPREWRRWWVPPLVVVWWLGFLAFMALVAKGVYQNHHLGGTVNVLGIPGGDPVRFLARDWTFVAAGLVGAASALSALALVVVVNDRLFQRAGRTAWTLWTTRDPTSSDPERPPGPESTSWADRRRTTEEATRSEPQAGSEQGRSS